jgi:hypothetical protein
VPVIREDSAIRSTQDVTQHQGRNEGIVERTSHGDELRDQIDGRNEPREGEPEPPLAASRDTRVAKQTPKQDYEVRHQGDQLACHRPLPDRHENDHHQQPDDNYSDKCDQKPATHTAQATAQSPSSPATPSRVQTSSATPAAIAGVRG